MFVFQPGSGCSGTVGMVASSEQLNWGSFDLNCATQTYDLIQSSNVCAGVTDVKHDSFLTNAAETELKGRPRYFIIL